MESTNLSVGRGTQQPFEWLGAPWLDAERLVSALSQMQLPGLRFHRARFVPRQAVYRGQTCQAVRLELTDARAFRPVATALAIASLLHRHHPTRWESQDLPRMLGHGATQRALLSGADPRTLPAHWQRELDEFSTVRRDVMRYLPCQPGE